MQFAIIIKSETRTFGAIDLIWDNELQEIIMV